MTQGILITEVTPRSPAAKLGIQPGDALLSINGSEVRDEIDLVFLQSDEDLTLEFRSRDGAVRSAEIRKVFSEDLGIRIEPMRTRRCNSNCIFCFVDQNPPGLRKPLSFKDGDFRMSFLHGNYITANELTKAELQRITQQRLSPLYISVHTTNPRLRLKMLGVRKGPDIMERLRFLTSSRIDIHAQIVLCPGHNDRDELTRTITDLLALGPRLLSIAVVPVGLTDFRSNLPDLHPVTPAIAKKVLEQGAHLQNQCLEHHDEQILFFADEFYILADAPWPDYSEIEVVHQLENGVGMLHHFYKEFDSYPLKNPGSAQIQVAILTGLLGARALEPAISRLNSIKHVKVDVLPLTNTLFGKSVTVSGLLSGKDFLRAVQGCPQYDKFLIPGNSLRDDNVFLDDVTLQDLQQTSPAPLEAIYGDAVSLAEAILLSS
jgi:putative radical SAM enzyme (TIGR03279 family)